MSKKNDTPAADGSPLSTAQQPANKHQQRNNGTTILTAKTRDELAEMVNDIHADVRYAAGAVGHNPETGSFTLRVDINP